MSFTNNLLLDLIIVVIAIIIILVIYKIISLLVKRAKNMAEKRKLIIKFLLRLITALLIIFLLLEGLPILGSLPPEFTAIIASSLSVAIAFASSGIFSNLISGFILIMLNPFELNDIVSIGNTFGAVREIKLTKTVIETFDNLFIQISNSDVISANIVKFSLKLEKIQNFLQFMQNIRQGEQEGSRPIENEDLETNQDLKLKKIFESAFGRKKSPKIHNFTFIMEFGFRQFRKKLEEINVLCNEYEERFGFKPRYHIVSFDHDIQVSFRLMTFDSDNLFKYQPEFAKKVYQIVQK